MSIIVSQSPDFDCAVHEAFNLRSRHRAARARDFLSARKDGHRRDRLNAEALAKLRQRVRVDLDDDEASGVRRGDACQRSEEHTSELQSRQYLVCRLLLEKKKKE